MSESVEVVGLSASALGLVGIDMAINNQGAVGRSMK